MEWPGFEYDYFSFQHSCAACHQTVRSEKGVSELTMSVTAELLLVWQNVPFTTQTN